MPQEVRVRFAPSPTGFLHIGGLRTALFNFLFARKSNGKFILRIEDTDQARKVEGALENIVQTLTDFDLSADEGPFWDNGVKERGDKGPYFQSKRIGLYKQHADELIEKGAAYFCFCSPQRLEELRKTQEAKKLPPKYDRYCLTLSKQEIKQKLEHGERPVIRLNVNPNVLVKFDDVVHGQIEIKGTEIDDQVLLKSDGFPTYHLANVVDDHLMQITHVIRGDEWLPSTPKHILLYQAFGWDIPKFVHLPLLLSKTRKKLSKREGDAAVKDFLEQGYLPKALLNFVALLGWNPKTEEEIFSLIGLVEQFSLDKLNKSGAVFDLDKLDWLNGLYIRKLKREELFARIVPYLIKAGIKAEDFPKEFLEKVLSLEQERLKKLSEIGERVKYFFDEPKYDAKLLICPPARKATAGPLKLHAKVEKNMPKEVIMKNLEQLSTFIQTLDISGFKKENAESKIKKFIEEKGMKTGEVLWPLRVTLTGLEASPGPFEIMDAFGVLPNGKEIILKRINRAIELLF